MWRVGAQVSCEPPPPLPGGYVVGEQVYYTGASQATTWEEQVYYTGGAVKTFENGDRVEHGKQGKVVGPMSSEGLEGTGGVAVLFPGNEGAINCRPNWVRHRRNAATHSSPPPQLPLLPTHQHYERAR